VIKYVQGGPPRFKHQQRGLKKAIDTGGVFALLFDPGMGKTAVILDYAGLLALKSPTGEARVLVVCPLVAIDTWVLQAAKFMSPQVGYWAEAIGGSLLERAETLAARGGNPYAQPLGRKRPVPPTGWIELAHDPLGGHSAVCRECGACRLHAKRASTADRWWADHLRARHPGALRQRAARHAPRALHHDKSILIDWRHCEGVPAAERLMSATQGPDGVLGPRVVLEVTNLDTLASRAAYGSRTMADVMLGAIRRFAPDLVVVDESHKIKSPDANASNLLSRLTPHVRRRAILTGTVTPAGPLDVFGQWRFLEPFAFGDIGPNGVRQEAKFESFKQRYIKFGGWDNKELKGYHHLDEMQRIMAQNAAVARKAEALDLPPTTEVELRVDLSPAELKAYAEMKKNLAVQMTSGAMSTVGNRLTQMLRLRQITSGHLPEDNGPTQVIGTSKAELIRSLVHDTLAGERRIVIFCLFSHEIAMLAALIGRDPKTEVMVIAGGTDQPERQRMRARFGSDAPERIVLIAQIRTMSLAVNELVTANHAIFGSLSQQRDDLEQAKARLDRTGQTRPVTFWYAVAPKTVDEVILKSHRDRSNLENELLRHIAGSA
jgi:hypothetical protein